MKTGLPACVIGLVLLAAPSTAEANDFAGCFREGKAFAVCNGFVAGIAGLGSIGLAGASLLARSEEEEVGYIAGGIAAGMYSAISGSVLVATAEDLAPDDPLRDTSRVLGGVDIAVGGLGLAMTAVAGVKLAITKPRPRDDELALSLSPGVAGFSGTGFTLTLGF